MRTGALAILAAMGCGHTEVAEKPAEGTTVTVEEVDLVPERPTVEGDWWRIAARPDLGAYAVDGTEPVDFSIWRAADGTWQLVACVRKTLFPGAGRLLFRWEAQKLTDADWEEKGVFLTSDDASGYAQGQLQAPHVITDGRRYYMFYNSNGSAFVRVSDDGKTFTRLTMPDGAPEFFGMNRDVMVFDNRARDGKLYAYYTWVTPDKYPGRKNHTVGVRTAPDIAGPWSETMDVGVNTPDTPDSPYNFINAESPFVLFRNGLYYRWEQMAVFASQDPLRWEGPPVATMAGNDLRAFYAPEVVAYEGEFYVAGYKYKGDREGIYMARFAWR